MAPMTSVDPSTNGAVSGKSVINKYEMKPVNRIDTAFANVFRMLSAYLTPLKQIEGTMMTDFMTAATNRPPMACRQITSLGI